MRISTPPRLLSTLLVVCAASSLTAAAEDDTKVSSADGKKAQQAQAIFEKIKSLSGEWENQGHVVLSVKVIAGGSAVVQREFPGTPMEMMTVYHLDGDEVMLNHYCVLGNQPRLKASLGDRENTLVFSFVEATNMESINDPHMHQGKLTWINKDSIKSTWTKFVDGKPDGDHSFEMTRMK